MVGYIFLVKIDNIGFWNLNFLSPRRSSNKNHSLILPEMTSLVVYVLRFTVIFSIQINGVKGI